MFDFNHRPVLVICAAGGIGSETVRQLVAVEQMPLGRWATEAEIAAPIVSCSAMPPP